MDILITEIDINQKIGSTRTIWINPYQITTLDKIIIEDVVYGVIRLSDGHSYLTSDKENVTLLKQWADYVTNEMLSKTL